MECIETRLETERQNGTEEISNWENICRVCANVSGEQMIPIFDEDAGAQCNLGEKIHTYLPIKVSRTDSLPLKLCYNCGTTLLAWHDLSSGCLIAEKKLLQIQDEIERQKSKESGDGEREMPSSSGRSMDRIVVDSRPIVTQRLLQILPLTIDEFREKETVLLIKYIDKSISNQVADENIAMSELVDDPEPIATDTSKIVGENHNEKESDVPRIHPQEEQLDRRKKIMEQCAQTSQKTTERFGRTKKPYKQFNGTQRLSMRKKKKIDITDEKSVLKNGPSKLNLPLAADDLRRKNVKSSEKPNDQVSTIIADKPKTKTSADAKNDVTTKSEEPNGPTTINNESNGNDAAPSKVKCAICLKKYSDAKDLQYHGKLHENLPETFKIFQCIECDKTFRLKDSFVRHLRIHRDERPFTCHVCGKQFRDSGGLSRHIKDVHAKLKNFSCDLCVNSFSSKATRDDHRRTHTGERPYVCATCDKTFKSKACLYSHNKLHTNEFPHLCPYCDSKFRRRQEMLIHATTHTGEKNYSCDVCFVRFRVKTEVARHRLTHSDEKPFVCAKCGLRFRQKRYLTNHIKSRHSQSWNV